MPGKVYFKGVDSNKESREAALGKILDNLAKFPQDSFVGIKITIGDINSPFAIKPELVALVIDKIKSQKANPFVFDTNVIYKGKRNNAVDHLNLAYEKGFTPDKIKAPFIIADGVFGLDGRDFKVDYKHIKNIRVPSFVGVLDNLVVLSHITGHMMTGYSGAIKNVAMGMSCRPGKQVQHSSVKPRVNPDRCVMCGACIEICPVNAISKHKDKAFIDNKVCVGCGECLCACQYEAIAVNWKEDYWVFNERLVEYAAGILSKFKNKFFINCAFEITKECDCMDNTGVSFITQDAGIFASGDILALEKATADACTKKEDVFFKHHKLNFYLQQFEYAQKLALGNLEYELVQL